MPKPFVYLAALRRAGSKLLARALTRWPESYVLLEPGLAMPTMRAKTEPTRLLGEIGLDLPALATEVRAAAPERRPDRAVRSILEPLRRHVPLVGVKEIRHAKADLVLDALGPDTRVVVLVRDPRGILDSLRRKEPWRDRPIELPGGLGPSSLAEHLREQFASQRRMLETRTAVAVRYEDLCQRPSLVKDVRRFCGLPEDLDADLWRLDGHEPGARGDRIGNPSFDSWRTDDEHASWFEELRERLDEDCAYWGYRRTGERDSVPPGPPAGSIPDGT